MAKTRPQLPLVEPVYDKSRPMPNILPVYRYQLSNSPGKSIVGLQVTFPPNGSTPPHRHAGAFLAVAIFSGSVLNKVNNDPMQIIHAGGSFHEHPGCHHKISDNASKTEEVALFVTLVLDTEVLNRVGIEGLVEIDEEYRQ
ncbi:hypothetical protein G7Y89_g9179 [Cudoniella acicularis]|uniref:Cupin type-2 domain-containing protein n=1 Tax=Cudoniella acicularis TaxID=354080 RepID=A0A8H4W2U6_9HELO|nr:hypothetical protein G7Y89_g9179 [Cudoniella acicularis]